MARFMATVEPSSIRNDDPIIYNTDSHRPPPSEFASAFLQIAALRDQYESVWRALAQATREMQVFDFGVIDDNKLVAECKRGVEFYAKDFLRMPFRSCVFWYNAILDPKRMAKDIADAGLDPRATPIQSPVQRYATIAIDADAWGLCPKGSRMIAACDWLDMDCDPDLMTIRDSYPRITRKAFMLASSGYFRIIGDEHEEKRWAGNVLRGSASNFIDASSLGSLGDGVIGLSMILATRGISLKVEEPSAQLNAKRARSGKEPLVRVTHVDAAHYYQALNNTLRGGHHASPVPHLRRGHLRHYRSERFKNVSGTEKWIPDMIVNTCSLEEALAHRSHYEVKS